MSGFVKEFREFIIKGNAFDLAVGVIIGAAFSAIVNSLVADILMPPIGYVMGGIDFSSYFLDLTALASQAIGGQPVAHPASLAQAQQMGHAVIAYGKFINAIINLLIVGFVIFLLVKQVNRLKRQPENLPPAQQPDDVRLLTEIRDILSGGAPAPSPSPAASPISAGKPPFKGGKPGPRR
jgi:large conductance mechanosensitive channel